MPEYLWTGKDKSGSEFALRIEAPTAGLAKAELEERGATDLKLHTYDAMDAFRDRHETAAAISAEDEMKYRRKGSFRLREIPLRALKDAWKTILLLLLASTFCIYREEYYSAIVLACVVLIFPVIQFWFFQNSFYFTKLNQARVWHRWAEVMVYIEKLKRARLRTKRGVDDKTLIRYQAMALAGSGELEEAVKIFAKLSEDPKMPRWLFLCQLASIYEIAKLFDKAIDLSREAAALKPDDPVLLIDFAYRLTRYQLDTANAKAILDQAEKQVVIEMAKPHILLCRGIIALIEKDFAKALLNLQKALEGFRPFSQHVMLEGNVLITKAYLSCAEGALGNKAAAARLFHEVRSYLEATRQDDLLTECKRSAGEL